MRLNRGTMAKLCGQHNGAEHVDMHVNTLNPDSGPGPCHYHAESDNVYFVLEGEISVVVEGEEFRLGRNDALFIPPGLRHATSNCGDVPAQFIEIYAPSAPDFQLAETASEGS
jgi:mannose-6-phosphate isomerase-like protein (cupin superfamily)